MPRQTVPPAPSGPDNWANVLRSSVAAVVVSGRVCGSQVDGPGVVGNGAGRVLLQSFGLGAVVIRGVIFWIQFGRAVEISYRPVQVTLFRFFDSAINKIAVGRIRSHCSRRR